MKSVIDIVNDECEKIVNLQEELEHMQTNLVRSDTLALDYAIIGKIFFDPTVLFPYKGVNYQVVTIEVDDGGSVIIPVELIPKVVRCLSFLVDKDKA